MYGIVAVAGALVRGVNLAIAGNYMYFNLLHVQYMYRTQVLARWANRGHVNQITMALYYVMTLYPASAVCSSNSTCASNAAYCSCS